MRDKIALQTAINKFYEGAPYESFKDAIWNATVRTSICEKGIFDGLVSYYKANQDKPPTDFKKFVLDLGDLNSWGILPQKGGELLVNYYTCKAFLEIRKI